MFKKAAATSMFSNKPQTNYLPTFNRAEQRSAVTKETGWLTDTAALTQLKQHCAEEKNSVFSLFYLRNSVPVHCLPAAERQNINNNTYSFTYRRDFKMLSE